MARRSVLFILSLLLISLSAQLSGCAGKSVDDNDPAALMADAESDIESDRYQIATDKLRMIKNRFPYSKVSIDAELKIADVYFMQESYTEAAAAYETFRDLHPKHDKVQYAMFRAAKSYFNDIPDPLSRDMTPASRAAAAYSEFIQRFPTAKEVEEAKKDLATVRSLLAQKELYIADFYFKRDFYDSARPRYQRVIDLYSDTPIVKEAQEKLARIEKLAPVSEKSKKGTEEKNAQ